MEQSQIEYLNLLFYNPKYIDNTIVKPEYLNEYLEPIFNAFINSYKLHGEIMPTEVYSLKKINTHLLDEIMTSDPHCLNPDNYIKELEKIIINDYKLRMLKNAIEKDATYDEVNTIVSSLNNINPNENTKITTNDLVESLTNQKKKIEFGYPVLDRNLNLEEQELLIIAGGTGTGKTAFALNLLYNISKKYECMYINLEMSKTVLYRRLVGIATGIKLKELNNLSELSEENKHKVYEAMKDIGNRNIHLVSKSVDISEIRREIASTKGANHMIVFIDHIGLIKSSGKSIYERMTNVAKELRGISLDYDCTLIGLCQLSRESQRENKEPKLQDLRDSGEVEQSARKVVMLYNPEPESKNDRIEMKIIIAKNDSNYKNDNEFYFFRETQKFSEKYY